MNIKNTLRLLAVVAIVTPGARLLAAGPTDSEAEQLFNRSFSLEVLSQDMRTESGRQALHDARLQVIAKLELPSAASFDLNGDGKLDRKESAMWSAAVRAAILKSPAARKCFDTNQDGRLDNTELASALGTLLDRK